MGQQRLGRAGDLLDQAVAESGEFAIAGEMPLFERLRDIIEFRAEDGWSAERDLSNRVLFRSDGGSAISPNICG